MIFVKILLSGLSLILIGGFVYFSVMDVPVHQKETVETLPASHFTSDSQK